MNALWLTVPVVLAAATMIPAQSPGPADCVDLEAITTAALDYGEGWYEGDASRMERALHPELAKRMVYTHPNSGRSRLSDMGSMTLVLATRAGGGTRAPADPKFSHVEVLDVFENAAMAKVVGPEWVDYLHLVKWNDRWVIINVLWEPLPEYRERLNLRFAGS